MKMEKMNAYISTTGKYHYILLTDKRKLTMQMLISFVYTIAEKQGISTKKVNQILNSREALTEIRKRINPCLYDDTGNIIKIYIGKSELHYPNDKTENPIVLFTEIPKASPGVTEFLKEV